MRCRRQWAALGRGEPATLPAHKLHVAPTGAALYPCPCPCAVGLRTTSTIMFGHMDGPAHWARHLARLRQLQKRTGGVSEFVPLPFVHMEAPLYLKGEGCTVWVGQPPR